ncbi:zinc finger, C3HC4 type domain containing protein, putative [Babesia bigemina]|uniref:RING-type E3 ubiquitin transferase n=1 Tax=Babesia bigemina TaxID=5866 RepID=A0A061D9S0_BABBI|nr:zinc finger, C3HC4 type domain containing protein, putative [Babesia bigemina]CDR94480.1 zinc finger, C3HC4 type domain containing protein, putative [Babesia bigemina]|eukprot:XP_012766666.1 zinc finger, C3HC4 type domain containing protein, putative [Babesia bigemina]
MADTREDMWERYVVVSHLLMACSIGHASLQTSGFYEIVMYYVNNKTCLAILYNYVFMMFTFFCHLPVYAFLGHLTALEYEQLHETARNYLMDAVLFLLLSKPRLNGRELPVTMLTKYLVLLVALKCFHILLYVRLSNVFQMDIPSYFSMLRLAAFIYVLSMVDCRLLCMLWRDLNWKNTFTIWVVFELVAMMLVCTFSFMRYVVNMLDFFYESGLKNKTTLLFYLELMHDVMSLLCFTIFVLVFYIHNPNHMPAYMLIDILNVLKNLSDRISMLMHYRKVVKSLESRYPKPTEEEKERDGSCIICRDDFDDDSRKIECGHVFHMSCLKSWLFQHSTCPTCRAPIEEYEAPRAEDFNIWRQVSVIENHVVNTSRRLWRGAMRLLGREPPQEAPEYDPASVKEYVENCAKNLKEPILTRLNEERVICKFALPPAEEGEASSDIETPAGEREDSNLDFGDANTGNDANRATGELTGGSVSSGAAAGSSASNRDMVDVLADLGKMAKALADIKQLTEAAAAVTEVAEAAANVIDAVEPPADGNESAEVAPAAASESATTPEDTSKPELNSAIAATPGPEPSVAEQCMAEAPQPDVKATNDETGTPADANVDPEERQSGSFNEEIVESVDRNTVDDGTSDVEPTPKDDAEGDVTITKDNIHVIDAESDAPAKPTGGSDSHSDGGISKPTPQNDDADGSDALDRPNVNDTVDESNEVLPVAQDGVPTAHDDEDDDDIFVDACEEFVESPAEPAEPPAETTKPTDTERDMVKYINECVRAFSGEIVGETGDQEEADEVMEGGPLNDLKRDDERDEIANAESPQLEEASFVLVEPDYEDGSHNERVVMRRDNAAQSAPRSVSRQIQSRCGSITNIFHRRSTSQSIDEARNNEDGEFDPFWTNTVYQRQAQSGSSKSKKNFFSSLFRKKGSKTMDNATRVEEVRPDTGGPTKSNSSSWSKDVKWPKPIASYFKRLKLPDAISEKVSELRNSAKKKSASFDSKDKATAAPVRKAPPTPVRAAQPTPFPRFEPSDPKRSLSDHSSSNTSNDDDSDVDRRNAEDEYRGRLYANDSEVYEPRRRYDDEDERRRHSDDSDSHGDSRKSGDDYRNRRYSIDSEPHVVTRYSGDEEDKSRQNSVDSDAYEPRKDSDEEDKSRQNSIDSDAYEPRKDSDEEDGSRQNSFDIESYKVKRHPDSERGSRRSSGDSDSYPLSDQNSDDDEDDREEKSSDDESYAISGKDSDLVNDNAQSSKYDSFGPLIKLSSSSASSAVDGDVHSGSEAAAGMASDVDAYNMLDSDSEWDPFVERVVTMPPESDNYSDFEMEPTEVVEGKLIDLVESSHDSMADSDHMSEDEMSDENPVTESAELAVHEIVTAPVESDLETDRSAELPVREPGEPTAHELVTEQVESYLETERSDESPITHSPELTATADVSVAVDNASEDEMAADVPIEPSPQSTINEPVTVAAEGDMENEVSAESPVSHSSERIATAEEIAFEDSGYETETVHYAPEESSTEPAINEAMPALAESAYEDENVDEIHVTESSEPTVIETEVPEMVSDSEHGRIETPSSPPLETTADDEVSPDTNDEPEPESSAMVPYQLPQPPAVNTQLVSAVERDLEVAMVGVEHIVDGTVLNVQRIVEQTVFNMRVIVENTVANVQNTVESASMEVGARVERNEDPRIDEVEMQVERSVNAAVAQAESLVELTVDAAVANVRRTVNAAVHNVESLVTRTVDVAIATALGLPPLPSAAAAISRIILVRRSDSEDSADTRVPPNEDNLGSDLSDYPDDLVYEDMSDFNFSMNPSDVTEMPTIDEAIGAEPIERVVGLAAVTYLHAPIEHAFVDAVSGEPVVHDTTASYAATERVDSAVVTHVEEPDVGASARTYVESASIQQVTDATATEANVHYTITDLVDETVDETVADGSAGQIVEIAAVDDVESLITEEPVVAYSEDSSMRETTITEVNLEVTEEAVDTIPSELMVQEDAITETVYATTVKRVESDDSANADDECTDTDGHFSSSEDDVVSDSPDPVVDEISAADANAETVVENTNVSTDVAMGIVENDVAVDSPANVEDEDVDSQANVEDEDVDSQANVDDEGVDGHTPSINEAVDESSSESSVDDSSLTAEATETREEPVLPDSVEQDVDQIAHTQADTPIEDEHVAADASEQDSAVDTHAETTIATIDQAIDGGSTEQALDEAVATETDSPTVQEDVCESPEETTYMDTYIPTTEYAIDEASAETVMDETSGTEADNESVVETTDTTIDMTTEDVYETAVAVPAEPVVADSTVEDAVTETTEDFVDEVPSERFVEESTEIVEVSPDTDLIDLGDDVVDSAPSESYEEEPNETVEVSADTDLIDLGDDDVDVRDLDIPINEEAVDSDPSDFVVDETPVTDADDQIVQDAIPDTTEEHFADEATVIDVAADTTDECVGEVSEEQFVDEATVIDVANNIVEDCVREVSEEQVLDDSAAEEVDGPITEEAVGERSEEHIFDEATGMDTEIIDAAIEGATESDSAEPTVEETAVTEISSYENEEQVDLDSVEPAVEEAAGTTIDEVVDTDSAEPTVAETTTTEVDAEATDAVVDTDSVEPAVEEAAGTTIDEVVDTDSAEPTVAETTTTEVDAEATDAVVDTDSVEPAVEEAAGTTIDEVVDTDSAEVTVAETTTTEVDAEATDAVVDTDSVEPAVEEATTTTEVDAEATDEAVDRDSEEPVVREDGVTQVDNAPTEGSVAADSTEPAVGQSSGTNGGNPSTDGARAPEDNDGDDDEPEPDVPTYCRRLMLPPWLRESRNRGSDPDVKAKSGMLKLLRKLKYIRERLTAFASPQRNQTPPAISEDEAAENSEEQNGAADVPVSSQSVPEAVETNVTANDDAETAVNQESAAPEDESNVVTTDGDNFPNENVAPPVNVVSGEDDVKKPSAEELARIRRIRMAKLSREFEDDDSSGAPEGDADKDAAVTAESTTPEVPPVGNDNDAVQVADGDDVVLPDPTVTDSSSASDVGEGTSSVSAGEPAAAEIVLVESSDVPEQPEPAESNSGSIVPVNATQSSDIVVANVDNTISSTTNAIVSLASGLANMTPNDMWNLSNIASTYRRRMASSARGGRRGARPRSNMEAVNTLLTEFQFIEEHSDCDILFPDDDAMNDRLLSQLSSSNLPSYKRDFFLAYCKMIRMWHLTANGLSRADGVYKTVFETANASRASAVTNRRQRGLNSDIWNSLSCYSVSPDRIKELHNQYIKRSFNYQDGVWRMHGSPVPVDVIEDMVSSMALMDAIIKSEIEKVES